MPIFIFLPLYDGLEPRIMFRVSVVLWQNLNSSLFSFWNRRLNHNYFFNLTLGKVLVVQWYPEIWAFQETSKCPVHHPEHCLISQRQGNVPSVLFAFSITALMGCTVVVNDCYREITLLSSSHSCQPPRKGTGERTSAQCGTCPSVCLCANNLSILSVLVPSLCFFCFVFFP